MIKNYLLSGIRFFNANRSAVTLNIVGLATGLFVFLLAISLQEHERQHDNFFPNGENIVGVYTRVLPSAGYGTSRVFGTPPIAGPLVSENISGIEASSRYLEIQQAVRVDEFASYESIKFVDPGFTEIFEFDYLAGSPESLFQSGSDVLITREAAMRYFGRVDVIGEPLRVGGTLDVNVMAVIEDLPANSHMVYRFGTAERLQFVMPMDSLALLESNDLVTSWDNVSDRYRLWLKLVPGTSAEQIGIDISLFLQDHIDASGEDIIDYFQTLPLTSWNFSALDADGISLISVAVVLSGLVLIVAALNYSNLFTALIARRLKELSIRKMLGALRWHLSLQLIIESLVLTTVATLVALFSVWLFIPVLGAAVGKDIAFSNLLSLNLSLSVLLVIGITSLLSVLYPIYVVNRLAIVSSLRGQALRGKTGARIRTALVVIQFSFNMIIGTLMATTFFQNQHLLSSNPGFNSDDVVIVSGITNSLVAPRQDLLATQLLNLDSVLSVAGASQHPYLEIHNQGSFSNTVETDNSEFNLYRFSVDEDFFELYEIELLAGRFFNRNISSDIVNANNDSGTISVIINQSALPFLNIDSADNGIGQIFYSSEENQATQAFQIVGIVNNANLLGLANDIKPAVFRLEPSRFSSLSVKLDAANSANALAEINAVWTSLFPEIPVETAFLEDSFRSRYQIFAGINRVLIGLSTVSILLAAVGLYGLVSVLGQQRRRELAIRKVFGASLANLLKLLSWQFTKPVSIALVLSAPLAIVAGGQYLNLFAERIEGVGLIAMGVSLAILLLALLTVSGQILRIAKRSPSHDLRYE